MPACRYVDHIVNITNTKQGDSCWGQTIAYQTTKQVLTTMISNAKHIHLNKQL